MSILDLSAIERDDAEVDLYVALLALAEYTRKTGRATMLQIDMETGVVQMVGKSGPLR